MLIAQISDCHVVEPDARFIDRIDSAAGLLAAVATIEALEPRPDLVLATGDLVNDGTPDQYDHLVGLLAGLRVPLVPVMGNHDDRTELRRHFPQLPPGGPDDPIDHVVTDHAVAAVVLDSTSPGSDAGHLSPAQCDWLDRRLADLADRPVLVLQHHPPLPSGIPWMDDPYPFTGADLEAEVLHRHPQVLALLCGHLHRSYQQRFGGTVVSVAPSTACALALGFSGTTATYTDEPTGLLLHRWDTTTGLTTHQVPIGAHDRWSPPWA